MELLDRFRVACLALSSILLLTVIACNTLSQEPPLEQTEPILVAPLAFQTRVPTARPTQLPRLKERPAANSLSTPTPTPWPAATTDASKLLATLLLATPTLIPTATPVETIPTPKPTRIPTLSPKPTTESTSTPPLTRERAIWMASHGLSLARQNLEGADLSNHAWGEVNFAYSNLSGVNFTGAILNRANLRHVDLTGADFTGADLSGADFTGADITGATFKDLSSLNWIERELILTGELPRIPKWFFPPLAEDRLVWNTKKGDRVAQGQKLRRLSSWDWCDLNAMERLMVKDYALWLGNNIDDWLDEQKIRDALVRCPPAVSSYWETKRP